MYDTTYQMSSSSSTLDGAALAGFLMFVVLMTLVAYAISAFFLGKVFKKAGVPAWAAWVPVYNSWKLFEMGGQQGVWAILMLIPVINIVATILLYIAMYHIGEKFGKDGAFVLLAIFLPLVWVIWLALDDKAVWQGSEAPAAVTPPSDIPPATPPSPVV